jgi:hypothetical protein
MANMSSYVDYHRAQRVSPYRERALPRRNAVRLKAAMVVVILTLLWVGMIRVAYGGGRTGSEEIRVQVGQTLWSIASARYPDDDTRQRVQDIVELNHLGSGAIYPGETLKVPAR